MSDDDRLSDAQGEETEERYRELLEELRTVMPGTQVLFAFLLTAAFSERFRHLDALGKRSYATALLLAGLAAVTLMGPPAFHRMSAPGRREEQLLVSIKLQVIGMALLLAAITIVTFVVIRLVFDDTAVGLVFAGVVGGAGVTIWYLLPKAKHLNQADRPVR
jgi:MFS family permease